MPGVVAADSLAAALAGGPYRPTWHNVARFNDRRFTVSRPRAA